MSTASSTPVTAPLAALSASLAAIVEAVGTTTLSVPGRHRRSLASAVVWKPGVVVTAAHVFRRKPSMVPLVGADGKATEAMLAGIDSPTDIAVFRVSEDTAAVVSLGDPVAVKAGSLVVAVGRSAGGDLTASHGIVNRSSGPWESWLGGQFDRMIRLDGGIHEGLSGGAVADADGGVVGIATAGLSRRYGMVVPASTVTRVVDAILSKGHVPRAFLGIGAQQVPLRASGQDAGEQTVGLLITALASGGPAEAAGMLVGDILVNLDGKPADSLHGLRHALSDKVGQAIQVTIHRGGVATELTLTVGQWPAEKSCC